ncbi:MAG: phosphoribosylformylglycinamidine cyclo-ligase [Gemmatimonadales bacterium]|nr:phosphoribosylformylglycinamidine cyclo-ligase [Gemmatimonadales bacterium]MBA3554108.1 phosphoribosylformylglycinamidine cyclo-ligase [Gemmatimonadales bacterium]
MSSQYAAAGVDLESADAAKARIGQLVASTRTPLSLGEVGAFGGMVRVPAGMRRPTLVLSTDGVGTKVLVALQAGRYDTVGEDLVNHSVNDILVHGAAPIAFMDYIAGSALAVEQIAGIVEGIARGCRAHDMALAGGETAQMPGLYQPGTYDLAGTIIGIVEEDAALHGDRIVPGDLLLGYASTGLHTNGYTLARRIVFERMGLGLNDRLAEVGSTVGEALLAVHRSYLRSVTPVISRVHGLAHITGGGIAGNLVRILPPDCEAVVDPESWEVPPLFLTLQRAGEVSTEEMRDVFNLGVGLVAVLPPEAVPAAAAAAAADGVTTWPMGEIRRGPRAVRFART